MSDDIVKFGIFGAGSIAIYRHTPEISANPWGEVVAIYDPITERAEWLANQLAEQYGAEVEVVDSEEAILENEEIEAVVVATPTATTPASPSPPSKPASTSSARSPWPPAWKTRRR
jgi:predicted dehydrogenase